MLAGQACTERTGEGRGVYRCRCIILQVDVHMRMERDVRESPSMIAKETHNIQPAAPVCLVIGPGAHPFCLAAGPSQAHPNHTRTSQHCYRCRHAAMFLF